MHHTIQHTVLALSKEYAYERALSTVVWFLVGCSVLGYIYLTSMTIIHAVSGKRAAVESMQAATAIAHLEGQHFSLTSTLSQSEAARFNLTAVQTRHFVQKTSLLTQATR